MRNQKMLLLSITTSLIALTASVSASWCGCNHTVHHPSKPTVIWPVKPVHHPVKPVCGCCGASSHGTGPNPAELHNPGTGIPIPLPLPGAVDPIDTHGPTGSHGSHHSNGVIRGTKGNDNLHGTEKADRIKAKGGNDVIYTGAGNDIIYSKGADTINGGNGKDIVLLKGTMDDYTVTGSADNLVLKHRQSGRKIRLIYVEKVTFGNMTCTTKRLVRNRD